MSQVVDPRFARRRMVVFASLDDVERDLGVLETAHRVGRLRRLGNREPGAIFQHLAVSIRGSFDGMPELNGAALLWLRLVGPFVKSRVLAQPLRPGVRMASRAEQALWEDDVNFEAALAALRQQIDRLRSSPSGPEAKHPIFGRLTSAEWRAFHLRHAELHLSFLDPG